MCDAIALDVLARRVDKVAGCAPHTHESAKDVEIQCGNVSGHCSALYLEWCGLESLCSAISRDLLSQAVEENTSYLTSECTDEYANMILSNMINN